MRQTSPASTSQMRGVPISRRSAASSVKFVSPGQPNRKSWNKLEADHSVENRLEKLRQKRATRVSRLSATKKVAKVPSKGFRLKNFNLKRLIFGEEGRPILLQWLIKITWLGLCGFLLHVCFGSRGVVEYYMRVQDLNKTKKEITILKEENNSLVYEINQIENSPSFQKKGRKRLPWLHFKG